MSALLSFQELIAKPIIDIMCGVESLEISKPVIDILVENGYCYAPYKTDVMHWFCKPSPEMRTHHLHLVPYESPLWCERLKFRDRLRANQALANEYAILKKKLASENNADRELYTQSKGPFVKYVLNL